MARLDQLPEPMRSHIAGLECPSFETNPWVQGPPLHERRVALVSTAGLHRRDDRPFQIMSSEYRIIPGDTATRDLVMSHTSSNFDRTGFQQDLNVVFPLDRVRELAEQGILGSVASFHYSFMGAADPKSMEVVARDLAGLLKDDLVDAVLLVPV
ncbi:MAG: selenoprotein B glycine/betaine/sarcosine/D-proline reductase [Desulfomonile tiedjei]|uniref:Selenoprotein B glycine/betaine/sarcosine/D-proline reductase n=1 Tax=Desulfomonile tiedjei TaxID=2358 RepID=A0A9D6V3Z8_9BACT|nr:selenoprotein B glycine/betaine/sarcosine/D-proline reductase [Desulfomonile tiedjei]